MPGGWRRLPVTTGTFWQTGTGAAWSEWQRVAMLLWAASPQSVLSTETQTGLGPGQISVALKMKLLEAKIIKRIVLTL